MGNLMGKLEDLAEPPYLGLNNRIMAPPTFFYSQVFKGLLL